MFWNCKEGFWIHISAGIWNCRKGFGLKFLQGFRIAGRDLGLTFLQDSGDCREGFEHRQTWHPAPTFPPFSGPVCPPNQHYELCGSPCPPTCRGQTEDEGCDESSPCTEGCFCDAGFLQSGDRCVPLARCGCLHDGRYYQRGEDFFSCPRCTQRCTCKGDGELECREASCGEGEACTVQDGVRGCYPSSCGRCEVLGAASFRTFDGRPLRFAGSCTYTLAAAEAAGPEVELVPFAVRVQKDHRGPEPLAQQLLVTVHGVTVSMSRGKQWEVKVRGKGVGARGPCTPLRVLLGLLPPCRGHGCTQRCCLGVENSCIPSPPRCWGLQCSRSPVLGATPFQAAEHANPTLNANSL